MSRIEEDIRSVYEQYWEHARHQEMQRLTFTSIYGALVAGSLALVGSSSISEISRLGIFWGILFVSVLGFLLCHFWRIPFLWFTRLAEQVLLQEFKLKQYRRFADEEGSGTKFGSASDVFHFFYILMTVLFTFLLGIGYHLEVALSFAIALIVFALLALIFGLVFKRREKEVETKIRNRFSSPAG